jgi:transposase-like protein
MFRPRKRTSPFHYFNLSIKMIWLVVLIYVCCPLLLRNAKDLLFERGIDIRDETVRL